MESKADPIETSATQRIDQWLCFSRLVKSRTLAQALIERGKVRINRVRIDKPGHIVRPGDVLTLSMGPHVRVFEILGLGARRGPAHEAQLLYRQVGGGCDKRQEGAAPCAATDGLQGLSGHGQRTAGEGRPTKRDRRQTDRLKNGAL